MGQALSKWIDGSLAALEGIESERNHRAAELDLVRRSAASQKNAVAELDREIEKLTGERKQHAARLADLDRQVATGTEALATLDTDLEMMAQALDRIAGGDLAPRPARTPAPAPVPAPALTPAKAPAARSGASFGASFLENAGVPNATRARASRPIGVPVPVPVPVLDDDDDLLATTRGPWPRIAGAAAIVGLLVGGGYAALHTEAGTSALDQLRTHVTQVRRDLNV